MNGILRPLKGAAIFAAVGNGFLFQSEAAGSGLEGARSDRGDDKRAPLALFGKISTLKGQQASSARQPEKASALILKHITDVAAESKVTDISVKRLMKTLDGFEGISYARHRVKKENPSWTEAKLNAAVKEYKRWWVLKNVCGLERPFPMLSDTVDTVWHAHLLFTQHYAAESNAFFGEFLHHSPYTTTESKATALRFREGVAQFSDFVGAYEETFGEPLGDSWQDAVAFVKKYNAAVAANES